MKAIFQLTFTCLLTLALAACASKYVTAIPSAQRVTKPEPDKSLIYFIAGKGLGHGNPAIYDGDQFIGILAPDTYIAYQATPGQHLLTAVGFTTMFGILDFAYLQADVRTDKIYYARVQYRQCSALLSTACLEFVPYKSQLSLDELKSWFRFAKQVQPNEEAINWSRQNAQEVQEKKARMLPNSKLIEWLK